MSVIQLPSQSQMRNQNENHKAASPQLHFLQKTPSNSFIFLMSCIILDPLPRLLSVGNDSKGRKKFSSVFKLHRSSFLLMCAVGKRCGGKEFHLKEAITLTRRKKFKFTNGLHGVPLLYEQLCSGNVDVHPQCLLLLIKCVWRPGVLAENKRREHFHIQPKWKDSCKLPHFQSVQLKKPKVTIISKTHSYIWFCPLQNKCMVLIYCTWQGIKWMHSVQGCGLSSISRNLKISRSSLQVLS